MPHPKRANKSRTRLPVIRQPPIQRSPTWQNLFRMPQDQIQPVLMGPQMPHMSAEDLQKVPAFSATQKRMLVGSCASLQAAAVVDFDIDLSSHSSGVESGQVQDDEGC